jgi:hypothetical protein
MTRPYISASLWLLMLLIWPASVRAQTDARVILDNAIQTLGGDAYLDAADVKITGRFFQFQRGELVGGESFVDHIQFPDKERTEFGDDGDIVRINNGVQGWNVNDEEVTEQIPEQIDLFWEEFKVSLDYLLRYVVNDTATTLQYLGREMIDFKRADILEIRDDDRTRVTLYIERESGLLMKKSVRRLNDPAVHEEVYSNFHDIDGVLTPLLIHRYTNGLKTMELRYDELSYNNGFSDLLFVEPSGR